MPEHITARMAHSDRRISRTVRAKTRPWPSRPSRTARRTRSAYAPRASTRTPDRPLCSLPTPSAPTPRTRDRRPDTETQKPAFAPHYSACEYRRARRSQQADTHAVRALSRQSRSRLVNQQRPRVRQNRHVGEHECRPAPALRLTANHGDRTGALTAQHVKHHDRHARRNRVDRPSDSRSVRPDIRPHARSKLSAIVLRLPHAEHYQRLLNYIVPDFVHVLYQGKIVKSGGKELALELEAKGYDWVKNGNKEAVVNQ